MPPRDQRDQEVSQLIEKLNEEVELITDQIRYSYLKQKGDHLRRLQNAINDIHAPLERGADIIDHIDQELLEKLGITLTGIHYKRNNSWIPIILKIGPNEYRFYQKAIPAFGIEKHFAMMESDEEFSIMIPPSFFKQDSVRKIGKYLKSLEKVNQINHVKNEISRVNVTMERIEEWEFFPTETRKYFQELEDLSLMVATSCFLTFRSEDWKYIYIYHHPMVGGVATVSGEPLKQISLQEIHKILQRRMSLIALMDGYLESHSRDYTHYDVTDKKFKSALIKAAEDYVSYIQLPQSKLKDSLEIDYFNPVTVVERVGNKKSYPEYRIILRLKISHNNAFNFLYADNAMIFNRIEEYLNGWTQGYLKNKRFVEIRSGEKKQCITIEKIKLEKIKLRLDVYISPKVTDVEARKANLYAPEQIQVDSNSNFYIWYKSVFDAEPPNSKIPAVIYRFSEMVGPSIFVGEIASVILKHYVTCHDCHQKRPINVLNLFSGTLACELTVIKRLKDDSKDILPLSFQSIDLNTNPLTGGEIKDQVKEVKRYAHIVPVDIFTLFSHLEKDPKPMEKPNDIYSKGYDMVIADPPHYLTLDYLYQRVRWIKEGKTGPIDVDDTLFEHMVRNKEVRSFILYFAHKEKEWMGFFIHRIFTKAGWPHVWSILIGDERIVVCFDRKLLPKCKNKIVEYIKDLKNIYQLKDKSFDIKVYDTLYRKL